MFVNSICLTKTTYIRQNSSILFIKQDKVDMDTCGVPLINQMAMSFSSNICWNHSNGRVSALGKKSHDPPANVLFPGHNHLLTTGVDDPSL